MTLNIAWTPCPGTLARGTTALVVFIDIDGVLLRSANGAVWNADYELAPHGIEFLQWATSRFECRWLSARDRSGGHQGIIMAFEQALGTNLPPDLLDLILAVKPQAWTGIKTSGIDLQSNFLWIDDNPSTNDLLALERAGCLARWVEVNSDLNPDDLLRVMALLEDNHRQESTAAER